MIVGSQHKPGRFADEADKRRGQLPNIFRDASGSVHDDVTMEVIRAPPFTEGTDSMLLERLVSLLGIDSPPVCKSAEALATLKKAEQQAYDCDSAKPGSDVYAAGLVNVKAAYTQREKIPDIAFVTHDVSLAFAASGLVTSMKSPKTVHIVINAHAPFTGKSLRKVREMLKRHKLYIFTGMSTRPVDAGLLVADLDDKSTPSQKVKALADADLISPRYTVSPPVPPGLDLAWRRMRSNLIVISSVGKKKMLNLGMFSWASVAPSRPLVVLWDNDGGGRALNDTRSQFALKRPSTRQAFVDLAV